LSLLKVALTTLGCRSNHADTAAIVDCLSPSHIEVVPFASTADVYVVNTCTVTAVADRQSRQLIYRAHRRNPDALIIVTGCYPSVSPDAIEQAAPYVTLVPGVEPHRVAELIHRRTGKEDIPLTDTREHPFGLPQSRPYLKVQQGCPMGCAYCIVPTARPGSASISIEEALAEARSLVDAGAKELVITGTHLGLYGKDLSPKSGLGPLLKALATALPHTRLRISSLEPWDVTEELILTIADTPQVCRHLHLPLQSGAAATLKRMRRPYTPQRFADIVAMAQKLLPGFTLGTDIIVGFPNESNEDFEESRQFFEALPLAYAHVFPYSERPGTDAAAMKPKVQHQEMQARAKILRSIALEKKVQTLRAAVGNSFDVIFDAPPTAGQTHINGMSAEYFPFMITWDAGMSAASLATVRAVDLDEDSVRLIGERITPQGE